MLQKLKSGDKQKFGSASSAITDASNTFNEMNFQGPDKQKGFIYDNTDAKNIIEEEKSHVQQSVINIKDANNSQ